MISDLIQVVDTLDRDDLIFVRAYLDKVQFEPTTIFGMSGCEVNTDIRSNTRHVLRDELNVAQMLHDRMNKALMKYREELSNIHWSFEKYPVPGSWRTNSYRESIQILKYEPGQHYSYHYDEATDKSINEYHRTISIVLYLTDGFEGGRTCFPHKCFKPRAGQALIFPSNWCFPHESEKLISGEKIVAVTWYHSHYDFSE